jgi:hypothetical protein
MGEPDEVRTREGRPPRSSGMTLVWLLGGAVAVAVLLGQITSPNPSPPLPVAAPTTTASDARTGPAAPKPIGVESIRRCPLHLGGLILGGGQRVIGLAVERWDCDGLTQGPWSIVIRASGGHFGADSAVVTYPVEDRSSGVPSTKPAGGVWNPGSQTLVFPLGTSHGQIVGDLGQTTLENLAARVKVVNARPQFLPPGGFSVSAMTTFRPPDVHEMSYQSADLGLDDTLGSGEVWTSVMTGAGLETETFVDRARPAGLVRGKPAIYTVDPYPERYAFQTGGTSGALAWESAPGEVTSIGFEGNASQKVAIEALRSLAETADVLSPTRWLNKDRTPVGR